MVDIKNIPRLNFEFELERHRELAEVRLEERPFWTLFEAAALWCGLVSLPKDGDLEYPRVRRKQLVLEEAAAVGQFATGIRGWGEATPREPTPPAFLGSALTTVERRTLKTWFRRHRRERPAFLFGPAEAEKTTGEPYLDPTHPNYAPELALAVKAWIHHFSEGRLPKSAPRDTVRAWLLKNGAKSIEESKRIATVVLPGTRKERRGAMPSSEEN